MKRKIEVTRDKRPFYQNGSPLIGRKAVMVDGKQWGELRMETHGRNGISYCFMQIGRHGYISPKKKHKNDFVSPFEVWSNRMSAGEYRHNLDARLLAMATQLVRTGYLRDPAVLAREDKEAKDRQRAHIARQKKAEADKFRYRAKEVFIGAVTDMDEMTDRVVKAMRWAQTR